AVVAEVVRATVRGRVRGHRHDAVRLCSAACTGGISCVCVRSAESMCAQVAIDIMALLTQCRGKDSWGDSVDAAVSYMHDMFDEAAAAALGTPAPTVITSSTAASAADTKHAKQQRGQSSSSSSTPSNAPNWTALHALPNNDSLSRAALVQRRFS